MTNESHALDIFLEVNSMEERVPDPDASEIIWERVEPKRVDIDWNRKSNCLNCSYERVCTMTYKTVADRKKALILGKKIEECPFNFWKDFTRFIGYYNMRNENLARTMVPLPVLYFQDWSFRHEIDIYKDKFYNFYEIFKMLYWIFYSVLIVWKWKWDDYWFVRTRKTVFMGFMVGILVGLMLSNVLLWITGLLP